MDRDLYGFSDYRSYLKEWILAQPKKGRGLQVALANAIHSPVSHVSQVFKGVSDFSFEQAEEINEFLGHTPDQSEYFLLLIQFARAGSLKLKKRVEAQLAKIREKQMNLKNRLQVKHSVSPESQAIFYSSWLYAAVHIVLTIKRYQTKEEVAKYFKISLRKAAEIIEFLMSMNLVTQIENRYTVGTGRIHLGADSPMISKHHINWRLQAIQSLEYQNREEDLHYSSVVSISKDDAQKIKALLIGAIEKAKLTIKDSKEEELHSLCMDFFKV